MIAPPAAEAAPCPPDASPEERKRLGYNAEARLAGPNLNAFVEVADTLRKAGLAAPQVYAADADNGFALLEDLGDNLFARAISSQGAAERPLYEAAVDALAALWNADLSPPVSETYTMLSYDETALSAETALLPEWYWPLKKGEPVHDDLQAEYRSLWADLLKNLSQPHVIALRDYHAENLLWRPDRKGLDRVGVIDFQDALYGAAAYDLVSLLEDARRDVDPELAPAMIERYVELTAQTRAMPRDHLETDYAILAAQRNAKILGIFARLAERDGKMRYLELLPRVEAHFRNDLKRAGLEDLHRFFARHFPDLSA